MVFVIGCGKKTKRSQSYVQAFLVFPLVPPAPPPHPTPPRRRKSNVTVIMDMHQGERSRHREIKEQRTARVAKARAGVLLLRKKHKALVSRRAQEVVYLSDEMSALRRGVTELEKRMFAAW